MRHPEAEQVRVRELEDDLLLEDYPPPVEKNADHQVEQIELRHQISNEERPQVVEGEVTTKTL